MIVEGRDSWGRTLAQVVTPDGTVLNRELVRVGLAWWYYSFAPKDRDLERLQAEAKAAGAGLWADPHPMAPWFFRDVQSRRSLFSDPPPGPVEVTAAFAAARGPEPPGSTGPPPGASGRRRA